MNVSDLRRQWREFKKAFDAHLGPVLGPRWASKAFTLGLGPVLDDLTKSYKQTVDAWDKASSFIPQADKGEMSAINEVQRKMASVVKHAGEVREHAGKAQRMLDAYQDVLQQGLNDALRRGSLLPAHQEAFRKAFGSLSVMRAHVEHAMERATTYYGRNAEFWQGEYRKRLQRR